MDTQIVLLPVEPYLVHVYWDVVADPRPGPVQDDEAEETGPLRTILRVYRVSDTEDTEPRQVLEMDVNIRTSKCYIPLSKPADAYLAELGYVDGSGHFISLGRSNVARTPRAFPAEPPTGDEKITRKRSFPVLGKAAGSGFIQKTDIVQTKAEDLSAINESVFESGCFSDQFSSHGRNLHDHND